jgi:hypothetical protein
MTTRERERARANTQQAAQFTEIWIIGDPAEIAVLLNSAQNSGLLVYASPPTPMGGDDHRMRRYLRLHTSNHR